MEIEQDGLIMIMIISDTVQSLIIAVVADVAEEVWL